MLKNSKFDRRDFLAKITGLGVAGIVGSIDHNRGLPTNEPAAPSVRLDRLTAADFAALVGQTFRIERKTDDWVEVELSKVDSPRSTRRSPRPTFSVEFRLRGADPLPHHTYAVEHAQLGWLPLFLGAVGKSTGEVHLEAIFG